MRFCYHAIDILCDAILCRTDIRVVLPSNSLLRNINTCSIPWDFDATSFCVVLLIMVLPVTIVHYTTGKLCMVLIMHCVVCASRSKTTCWRRRGSWPRRSGSEAITSSTSYWREHRPPLRMSSSSRRGSPASSASRGLASKTWMHLTSRYLLLSFCGITLDRGAWLT